MRTLIYTITVCLIFVIYGSCTPNNHSESKNEPKIEDYLGQWALEIDGGFKGWLEVRQEQGYLDADLLWKWGSVVPVANVYFCEKRGLVLTKVYQTIREFDTNQQPSRVQHITHTLEIKREGDHLIGKRLEPGVDAPGVQIVSFEGFKMPPLPPAPDLSNLEFGDPIELFNGKDLTGWEPMNKRKVNSFSVVDGELRTNPVQEEGKPQVQYTSLKTVRDFEDFNLETEVKLAPGGNSGIYLRGMYEVQLIDSYVDPNSTEASEEYVSPLEKNVLTDVTEYPFSDLRGMGEVYSRIFPVVRAEKPAGTWQTFDITLCDRHITVILNGIRIIDNKPVIGPTGGAISSDVLSPGPIYLQGDHAVASFRNMILTPIEKKR